MKPKYFPSQLVDQCTCHLEQAYVSLRYVVSKPSYTLKVLHRNEQSMELLTSWTLTIFHFSFRSSSKSSKSFKTPNSTTSNITRSHPKPTSRSLHQFPEQRELHSTQQSKPSSHRPLSVRGTTSQHSRTSPRSGQLVTEQQHPAGNQVGHSL